MVKLPLGVLCSCLVLATGVVNFVAAQEDYAPQVGQVHPELTLPTITTRESVSLSDLRGKKVLLIHFASW